MTLTQNAIGCDIAKHHLDFFDPSDGTVRRIANTPEGIEPYLAGLAGRRRMVVYEATGSYDRLLRYALAGAGISAARVNPTMARRFAQACGRRAKTDALDAHMLAELGKCLKPEADEPPCESRETLSALAKRRDQLVAMRCAEKTRLHEAHEGLVRASLEDMLHILSKRIDQLDKQIKAFIAEHEALSAQENLLRTAPGIGPVAATTLLALMPELGALSPKKIAALAGLAPYNHDSGMLKGRRCISGGRRRVRQALYMAALSAIRHCARYRDIYTVIEARSKAKKIAIIAVARKLLTHLNAMLRDNKLWT
jgi:transposase